MTGPVDVTGWWAEVHKQFTLAFTPSLTGTAGSRTYAQQPLALTPVVAAAAQGYSGVSPGQLILPFTLGVTTTATAVPQASMGLSLTSAVAASAQGYSGVTAASMTLPFTIQIHTASGTPATPGDIQIDITPVLALGAAGAEHYTAATTLADAVTVAATGAEHYTAAATVADTPAITATGEERYSATAALVFTPAVTTTGILHPGPAFDAASNGTAIYAAAGTLTWTHPAGAANRDVIVAVGVWDVAPTSVKCGSITMTRIGTPYGTLNNNGQVALYRATGIAAAAQTITVTNATANYQAAASVSYTGITSVGTPAGVSWTTSRPTFTQSVSCGANQIIVQSFQGTSYGYMTACAGGTSRALATDGAGHNMLTINDATVTTTFTETLTTNDIGSGIAVVLS